MFVPDLRHSLECPTMSPVHLLSFAAPAAVISGNAVERTAGRTTGPTLGVAWAIVLFGSVPVSAYRVANGTRAEK
jgi:hypothetical protein